VRIYEAEKAAIFTRETTVCTHDNERDRREAAKSKGGGGERAVGLAVTQLRRRLIVSLAKTKGIWNNGQIGAFT